VIGVHCNKIGIDDLIKKVLITKKKEGRHNVYFLTDLAFWKKGRSFFPIYKEGMILNGLWSKMTPTEKALYIILGEKAKINDPKVLNSNYHAIGNIDKVCKYIKYAGISKPSFYKAYEGLCKKGYIEKLNQDKKYEYAIIDFSGHNNDIKSKDNLRKTLEIIAGGNSNSDIRNLKVIPKTAYQEQVDFENKKRQQLEIAERLKRVYREDN